MFPKGHGGAAALLQIRRKSLVTECAIGYNEGNDANGRAFLVRGEEDKRHGTVAKADHADPAARVSPDLERRHGVCAAAHLYVLCGAPG